MTVPVTLVDGLGYVWDIQGDGRIADGSQDAFDAGLLNPDQRVVSLVDTELGGRSIILRAGSAIAVPGVVLERRVYVPEDQPWARFIDTATNVSDAVITYTFRVQTNYGSDAQTQIRATSSGDMVLDASDVTFINDDATEDGGDPAVGIAFGDGSVAAGSAGYTSVDIAEYAFEVTLDPGESASVLSFAAQSQDLAALQALMTTLGGPVTAEMEYGIAHDIAETVINYDVTGFFAQTVYFGNEFADVLIGSDRNETFDALAGDDVVVTGAGADTVFAGYGNDVVTAGTGNDRVAGGGNNDVLQGEVGDDVLLGDHVAQVASAALTTADTGNTLVLTVATQDASDTDTVWIDGEVTRFANGRDGLNIVYLLDASATMVSTHTGSETVGDLNGDSLSNRLIDVAIAGFDNVTQQLKLAGLAAADLAIIAYNTAASVIYEGSLGAGAASVFAGIDPIGETSFEAPLQAAIAALNGMGPGENHVLFLSDGAPTDGNVFVDEVVTLRDPSGLNATIHAAALGLGASMFHVDQVDNTLADGSIVRVTEPSGFFDAFFPDPVTASEVASVTISVNGVVTATLDPAEFDITPLGLRFQADVSGLVLDEDDTVTVNITAADGAATSAAVTLAVPDGAAGEGNDTLIGGAGRDVLSGDGGADFLLGDAADDILMGGRGADHLVGGIGDDLLQGGAGDDLLHGGEGADTLTGGAGGDIVSYAGSLEGVVVDLVTQSAAGGDATGDVLQGFTGVYGTTERDILTGTDAPNIFRPGLGDDDVFGDADFDVVDYSDLNGGVYITLQLRNGPQNGWTAGFDYLNDIDGLIGSQFDDYLIGDSSYNELFGGDGNDVLRSKGGNDRLDGGNGDDRLTGDDGNERLIGGAGVDELFGNRGLDTLYGGSGDDWLYGGRDADEVYGQGGDDRLRGNLGFDTLWGGRGDDDMRGGGGGDLIYGEEGDDFILGENGNDTLVGGAGNDVLQGGLLSDVFLIEQGTEFDEIRDFVQGEDQIDLTAFDIVDFAAFQALASDRPSGLRIDFATGDVAFITGFDLATLLETDFIL